MLNFAKHLPPSTDRPRVLALDEAAAASLPPDVEIARAEAPGALPLGGPPSPPSGTPMVKPMASEWGVRAAPVAFDAIVGYADPGDLAGWFNRLRPGGRLILAARADPQTLLDALVAVGCIHCLVEPEAGYTLYRGERPPLDRLSDLAVSQASPISNSTSNPHLFLLVAQTPNKPAWRLSPGETLQWQAMTLLDPATGGPTLLAFSSLVRAVAFMQPAVLARKISGVNKIGKFPAAVVQQWPLPFVLNPVFDDWREIAAGPAWDVDPQLALTGEE